MKLALLSAFIALPILAQTIPNGAVYQAAAANGINYVSPAAGAAVLAEKAGTNWKTIISNGILDGTMGAAFGSVSGVFHIGKSVTEAVLVAHQLWDSYGQAVVKTAAPNPNGIISSLLPIGGTTTISPTACVDSYILTSKVLKGNAPVSAVVAGVSVTFSPQGVAVLVNTAGSKIRGLTVVDALLCPLAGGQTIIQQGAPGVGKLEVPDLGIRIVDAPSPARKTDTLSLQDPPVLSRLDKTQVVEQQVSSISVPSIPIESDNLAAPQTQAVSPTPSVYVTPTGGSGAREHGAVVVVNVAATSGGSGQVAY